MIHLLANRLVSRVGSVLPVTTMSVPRTTGHGAHERERLDDDADDDVRADFRTTLRFWVDRGVDGFRVDVAHGLVQDMSTPYPLGHRGRGTGPSFGFGSNATIPPRPAWFSEYPASTQSTDPTSTLTRYRRAIHLRRAGGWDCMLGDVQPYRSVPS